MPKCFRAACPNPSNEGCVHKDNGKTYCVSCARKINAWAGRELVSIPKPSPVK